MRVTGGLSATKSSPVTPLPPTTTSRMAGARILDREFDLRAVIKQQQIEGNLPSPSITASQISICENALKQLKLKAKGNGGRNLNGAIHCEYDTLQAQWMHNYKAFSQTAVALTICNRAENRYVNVLPYDSTRVVLAKKHSETPSSDYINASFVQDYVHEDLPRCIATQRPLPTTVNDLWTMVFQQRLSLCLHELLMVTE